MFYRRLWMIFGILSCLLAARAFAEERPFDDHWKFHRGEATGAERAEFDDSTWRSIDLPHDWSIEDLPPRDQDSPRVLSIRDGEWRFAAGDDGRWKNPAFNDSGWKTVHLPARLPGAGYFWFRRHVSVPGGEDPVVVDLGSIVGADEVFFNGERIGGNGGFPPKFEAYWSAAYARQRTYDVPNALRREGDNVVAVRIYCPVKGAGGLYDVLAHGRRSGPFDPGASVGVQDTGYTLGGMGWYRKRFQISPSQHVELRFDGVYMDSDVWVNGHWLGNHPYGYTPFSYDISRWVREGSNVVAVHVRNVGRNSRWYSGSGIYRHVWLTLSGPVRIPLWGIRVTTPHVSQETATVKVETQVEDEQAKKTRVGFGVSPVLFGRVTAIKSDKNTPRVKVVIYSPQGRLVAVNERSASQEAETVLAVSSPQLWSPANPALYRARVVVTVNGKLVDSRIINFGIRSISVDAKQGLCINGVPLKMKGGCLHHDNGPLGSRAIDRAEERRVELLRAAGYNALRTSHNPPSPAFLEACDRLGMLVMDEAFDQWSQAKTPLDYHRFYADWWKKDVAATVLRDRNHPSVIMWSIGNEIAERKTAKGASEARKMAEYVRKLDPTRPITSAYNEVSEQADGFLSALDVAGYNYNAEHYQEDHERFPERVIVCTESVPARLHDYWSKVETMPWVIGDFVWTCMDYLGESGIGHVHQEGELQSFVEPWPWHVSNCGDFDICGFKKPQSYYRDVVWGNSQLEMMVHRPLPRLELDAGWPHKDQDWTWGWPQEEPHWSWPGMDGKRMTVRVFSKCEQVRLELNGQVVDTRTPSPQHVAEFALAYDPGELQAVGLDGGRVVATKSFRTAGAIHELRMSADRTQLHASRNDLSYLTVEAVDALGTVVPDAAERVSFAVTGAGELAAVGNGDPKDVDSFQQSHRRLYQGRALAIVRPTGQAGGIVLTASTPGLAPVSVSLQAR